MKPEHLVFVLLAADYMTAVGAFSLIISEMNRFSRSFHWKLECRDCTMSAFSLCSVYIHVACLFGVYLCRTYLQNLQDSKWYTFYQSPWWRISHQWYLRSMLPIPDFNSHISWFLVPKTSMDWFLRPSLIQQFTKISEQPTCLDDFLHEQLRDVKIPSCFNSIPSFLLLRCFLRWEANNPLLARVNIEIIPPSSWSAWRDRPTEGEEAPSAQIMTTKWGKTWERRQWNSVY